MDPQHLTKKIPSFRPLPSPLTLLLVPSYTLSKRITQQFGPNNPPWKPIGTTTPYSRDSSKDLVEKPWTYNPMTSIPPHTTLASHRKILTPLEHPHNIPLPSKHNHPLYYTPKRKTHGIKITHCLWINLEMENLFLERFDGGEIGWRVRTIVWSLWGSSNGGRQIERA